MSETGRMLERAGHRFDMPEPAMERLLRRRDRKRRNGRIEAAAVGLVVAVVGIGWGLLAFRIGHTAQPASGGNPAPEAPGGEGWASIALPTIGIWIGVAVLGLTALAIVRLRTRSAEAFTGGATSGARAAPGHGQAPEMGTVHGKGGSEMDSEAKPDVRLTEMRIPEGRLDVMKVQRVNRWLIGAVALLAVALVAVGTWAIVDRSGGEAAATPTQVGLADASTVEILDGLNAAASGERFASFFTEDGVFEEHTNVSGVTEGRANIARLLQGYIDDGWHAERIGAVAQWGNFAAHPVTGPEGFTGMVIYELTPSGQIRHMWAFGDYK